MENNTIFALATARGKAGIAVVRISGPRALSVSSEISGDLPARMPVVRRLKDGSGKTIDQALVLYFPEGESFTGEETVEFQVHGSRAVVDALLSLLSTYDGVRMADAGEFTRRALENGRLDLTQVEGLADLINAETEAQRRQAYRVMSGAIGTLAQRWRTSLLRATALIEAQIDFSDEEIPDGLEEEVQEVLSGVAAELEREISGYGVAERIRDGFEVAIIGRPNVGKSTLLNRIAGRHAALTSEIAGTTRDVIEVRFDLRGLPVTFLDTAGIRPGAEQIEDLGIEWAKERARAADLTIFLVTKDAPEPALPPSGTFLIVSGKADLEQPVSPLAVSGKTGEGITELMDAIHDILGERMSGASSVISERQKTALSEALAELRSALDAFEGGDGIEIGAENIRRANHALEVLIGRVDVEAVLGEIFSSFCIGK